MARTMRHTILLVLALALSLVFALRAHGVYASDNAKPADQAKSVSPFVQFSSEQRQPREQPIATGKSRFEVVVSTRTTMFPDIGARSSRLECAIPRLVFPTAGRNE